MRQYWTRLYRSDFNLLLPRYWFGKVDSRPASLFRIIFALIMLKDAVYHLFIAQTFYSDDGLFPRDVMAELARSNRFSVMDAMPHTWQVQAFFLLWMVVLVCLLVGYRSRLMAVLHFFILISIHERNIYVLNGADTTFRVLSFWAMFIPMGQYYSIDAIRKRWGAYRRSRNIPDLRVEDEPRTIFALPLRMIQIQIAIVYLFTFLLKIPDDVWQDGEGLFYALQVKSLVLPTGDWFLDNMPMWVHISGSHFTLFMESTFIFFVFLPVLQPLLRALALAMGVMLHVGIGVLMSVPNFSNVMIVSYLTFFLPEWVVWFDKQLRTAGRSLVLPLPPAGSPLWLLLSITRGDEIALGDFPPDDYLSPNNRQATHYDGWVVLDGEGNSYQGVEAWQQVAAHIPLSRLWAWSLNISTLRALLWWIGKGATLGDSVLPQACNPQTPRPERLWQVIPVRTVLSVALVAMMGITLQWNLNSVKKDGKPVMEDVEGTRRTVFQYLSLWQSWSMFAPHPSTRDGWIVVAGVFENGLEMDLITEAPESSQMTQWYWGPDSRWKKYISNLRRNEYEEMLSAMGSYFCRKYNTEMELPKGERLATLEIHYHSRRSYAPGASPNPVNVDTLWRHWCYPEYKY